MLIPFYKVVKGDAVFWIQIDRPERIFEASKLVITRDAETDSKEYSALLRAQMAWQATDRIEVPPAAPMQWAGSAFGFARWLEKNYPEYRLEYVGPEPSNEPTPPGVSY